jgi:hypothetical protein
MISATQNNNIVQIQVSNVLNNTKSSIEFSSLKQNMDLNDEIKRLYFILDVDKEN